MVTDGTTPRRFPAWVAYVLAAVVWPLWCEIGVFAGAALGSIARTVLPTRSAEALGIGIAIVAWALANWALGRYLRLWLPPRVWLVTVAWLGIALVVALLAAGLADVRDLVGLLGVVGPFLSGAIGFAVGMRRSA